MAPTAGMWLSSAIQETLQPPCAWELLEAELLEHICAEVKRAHPSCDVPVEGEESLAEALEQTKGAARALLAEHAERVEEQHITVATAAAAANGRAMAISHSSRKRPELVLDSS